jgi:CRP-like cAMP-binding protein
VSKEIAAEQLVFRTGDPGDFFYLIDRGEVEVLGADRQRIRVLRAGDSFGEMALLNATPRTATARTLTSVSLWALSRVDLYAVLSRNTGISNALDQRAEAYVMPAN